MEVGKYLASLSNSITKYMSNSITKYLVSMSNSIGFERNKSQTYSSPKGNSTGNNTKIGSLTVQLRVYLVCCLVVEC